MRKYHPKVEKVKLNQILTNKGDLVVDKDRLGVIKNGKVIHLSRKEFDLLSLLISNPQKAFSRKEIFQSVWGKIIVGKRTIDVHIRKLRGKIGEEYILTIKGIGYKFSAPSETKSLDRLKT